MTVKEKKTKTLVLDDDASTSSLQKIGEHLYLSPSVIFPHWIQEV